MANVVVMAFFGLIAFNVPLLLLDADPYGLKTIHYLLGTGYALTILGAVGFFLLYYQSVQNKERFKKITITYSTIGVGPLVLVSIAQGISLDKFPPILLVFAELWGIAFLIANLVAVVSVIKQKKAPEKIKKKKKKVRTKKHS
jgi:hypothetical protein